jgi:hypothetical protein
MLCIIPMSADPVREILRPQGRQASGEDENYLLGGTVVVSEPRGIACIPGGVSPWGLAAGAPPLDVSSPPVGPWGEGWFCAAVGARSGIEFDVVVAVGATIRENPPIP